MKMGPTAKKLQNAKRRASPHWAPLYDTLLARRPSKVLGLVYGGESFPVPPANAWIYFLDRAGIAQCARVFGHSVGKSDSVSASWIFVDAKSIQLHQRGLRPQSQRGPARQFEAIPIETVHGVIQPCGRVRPYSPANR